MYASAMDLNMMLLRLILHSPYRISRDSLTLGTTLTYILAHAVHVFRHRNHLRILTGSLINAPLNLVEVSSFVIL